jgi:hypothetical protein
LLRRVCWSSELATLNVLSGISKIIDGVMDEYIKTRSEDGRFFIDNNGAFYPRFFLRTSTPEPSAIPLQSAFGRCVLNWISTGISGALGNRFAQKGFFRRNGSQRA